MRPLSLPGYGGFSTVFRPSRKSTQGAPEAETARFRPELSISDQPWVRSWERIARMRALDSQPPPPAPGWRGGPDKPYPGIRLVIVRQSGTTDNFADLFGTGPGMGCPYSAQWLRHDGPHGNGI